MTFALYARNASLLLSRLRMGGDDGEGFLRGLLFYEAGNSQYLALF